MNVKIYLLLFGTFVGCVFLLLTMKSPKPRRHLNTTDYFQKVYNTETPPAEIVFFWDSAPKEVLPPELFTPKRQKRNPLTLIDSLRWEPLFPGVFSTTKPAYRYEPNSWIEILRRCDSPPGCQYPLCHSYWGVVAPGSGIFMNIGAKPFIANNRIAAYHALLSKSVGTDQAWDNMATELDRAKTTSNILVQIIREWRKPPRASAVFSDMRKTNHRWRTFWVTTGLLLAGSAGTIAWVALHKHAWPVLLGFLIWPIWFYVGLLLVLQSWGLTTFKAQKAKTKKTTRMLLVEAAEKGTGLASLRYFDQELACLAKREYYTTILLLDQPAIDGTRMVEVCSLEGFLYINNTCEHPENYAQGLCSNIDLRIGPVINGEPVGVCNCCEGKHFKCLGCEEHISRQLCGKASLRCANITPPLKPCKR